MSCKKNCFNVGEHHRNVLNDANHLKKILFNSSWMLWGHKIKSENNSYNFWLMGTDSLQIDEPSPDVT